MALALSWQNWIDQSGAVLSTDSAAAQLPVTNLANPIIALPWRTSGATSAFVQADLWQSRSIGMVMFAGATLGESDTVRLRIGSTAGAGDLLDTTALAGNVDPGYGMWAYVPASPVSARYLRLDIAADSRAALGYFDIGRLWVGAAFRPAVNASYGYEEEWADYSEIESAERSGVALVRQTYQKRRAAFSLGFLSETEALDELREMGRIAGIRNQVAFVPDPDSSRINREAIIGRMTRSTPVVHPNFGIYSKVFEILEDK